MRIFESKYFRIAILLLSCFGYLALGYFVERQQFWAVFGLYCVVFSGFLYLYKYHNSETFLIKIGVLFRILLLLSTPFFSQDFYRFIWDGRLIASGINPYLYLPINISESFNNYEQTNFLLEKMGSLSAHHFSNYPPINQLMFALAALVSGKLIFGSILFFRIIILLADVGIVYFGRKILVHLNRNPNKIFLYFLNPLVILELSGNLHFEGVMLFFLILGFYYLIKSNWVLASMFIAISISVKLLPLLILPLFWQKLGFKKSVVFYTLIIGFNVLFFLPFINNQLIYNYIETIGLWFTNFEFNASFYYLVRAIGYQVKGYNIIGTVGKITPIITILMILIIAFFKNNKTLESIINNSLIVLTAYFFMSTTVHPWYVINLVLLSVFANFRYPIVWSFSIIMSYFAYSNIDFHENLLLISVEYILVFGTIFFEISKKNAPIINKMLNFKVFKKN